MRTLDDEVNASVMVSTGNVDDVFAANFTVHPENNDSTFVSKRFTDVAGNVTVHLSLNGRRPIAKWRYARTGYLLDAETVACVGSGLGR
jgi:hypothetical protein